ncbi:MAG TPA: SsrA-binding protein SmpB [Bacteroidales bacterium]|nr:SsrA-binding protein SmpB [Bacteroidales bacterium]HPE55798.1 SsrA-binding protein SmpB [Bacteroidales bacterium]HRX96001.1 SsrA-binding protein SmpB [Bacteroidales bacterium]
MQGQIKIKNKKASFEYYLEDRFEAGLELRGTEIKSIRMGKVSLVESYCTFRGDELFVVNMHIAEYDYGTYNNHEPKRERKLLLNRRELNKLTTKIKERGYSIVPTFLFINDRGLAKIEIALARGKKLYDKRESIKTKDTNRDMERHGF